MPRALVILSALTILASTSRAFADDPAPVNACKQLSSACKDAGYVAGGNPPKGKAMEEDCVRPMMRGATVPGVKTDPLVVSACKDERKWEKHPATQGTTPPTVMH